MDSFPISSLETMTGGYWAIGIIVSLGMGPGGIDMLRCEGLGLLRDPQMRPVVDHFSLKLRRYKANTAKMLKAEILVQVLPQVKPSRRKANLVEHAVQCCCTLMGDDETMCSKSARVWASAHDPSVDSRSLRGE